MKLHDIAEPLLEFGTGFDVCPRSGIANRSVYDIQLKARRNRLLIGAIGNSEDLEALDNWIQRCSREIPGKIGARQPNLFPAFCGFNEGIGFHSRLVMEQEITRSIYNSDIRKLLKIKQWNRRVEEAVELYHRHVKFLAQNRVVDVIVCVIPDKLYNKIAVEPPKAPEEETIDDESIDDDMFEMNFRRALKARTMHLGKPLQLLRETSLQSNQAGQQDDATKAWNFCTALYYKANKTVPWKLITDVNRPSVCFVGIGFYRSRDKKVLNTSLAQIFDELGNNVILRGTQVDIDKNDRRPHLKSDQASRLLSRALQEYAIALDTSPGRLVIHKSSNFSEAEIAGFRNAAEEMRVNVLDFVTVMDTDLRLFRGASKIYPPRRGTHLELDEATHLLYTRGSVPYYETYTGKYIPQPIEVRIIDSDESPSVICREILSLTKMNWNNTQFDGKYPITIGCARKVGQIMKYLTGENDKPQSSYSFYM